jgi:very-short-patch-repair endonuclease
VAEPLQRQLEGHKFRRQSVIDCFIADFLCPQKALIVEVDGDTHEEGRTGCATIFWLAAAFAWFESPTTT